MLTLILLPGMEGTGRLFRPLIDALGSVVRTQVVSYPGDSTDGYAALVDRVRAVLPTTGRYVILGESFSGPIAIALAAERPPGLRGLLLSCTFASNPHPALSPWAGLPAALPQALSTSRLAMRLLLGRFFTPDLGALLGAAIADLRPHTLRARLRAVAQADALAALAQVNVPLLYLRASDDRIVPRRAADEIRRVRSDVRIVDLQGPHFLLQSDPVRSAHHIREFLAVVAKRPEPAR